MALGLRSARRAKPPNRGKRPVKWRAYPCRALLLGQRNDYLQLMLARLFKLQLYAAMLCTYCIWQEARCYEGDGPKFPLETVVLLVMIEVRCTLTFVDLSPEERGADIVMAASSQTVVERSSAILPPPALILFQPSGFVNRRH